MNILRAASNSGSLGRWGKKLRDLFAWLQSNRMVTGVLLASLSVLLAYPWWDMWSGDAIIHLVYGMNAGRGDWFVYNAGEKSVGTTSIGWTMLLASLFRHFDLPTVLLLVKGFLFGSIVAIALISSNYFVGQGSRQPTAFIFLSTLAILSPGYLFNAGLGMENVVFTAMIAILTLTRLSPIFAIRANFGLTLLSTATLGIAAIIRPEGLVVLGLTLGTALLSIFLKKRSASPKRRELLVRLLVMLFGALTMVGLAQYFYFHETGMLLASASAESRIVLARVDSIRLGPIWFDPGFTVRLLQYLPLSGLAIIGAIRVISDLDFDIFHHGLTSVQWLRVSHVLLVLTFWLLYSFVVGASQVSRYTMFLLPLIGSLGVYAFSPSCQSRFPISSIQRRLGAALVFIGLFWIVGVYGIEYHLRVLQCKQQYRQHQLVEAPALRHAKTDSLLRSYGEPLNPPEPIRVAAREVQLRYFLDDRIYVVSVDGRTLPLGHSLPLRADGMVDEIGLLHQERPAYINDWFTRSSIRDSVVLPAIKALKEGATAVEIGEGITLNKRDSGFHVIYTR